MKLYNTLSRSLEEFRPLDPQGKRVTMYVCGPTVYDVPHIGHARSAYTFEVLRRYLEFKRYQVTFVRNVTDVDDKIIEKARQELVTSDKRQVTGDLKAKCREVAEKYLKSYHETMERLGIRRPDIEPKATEHVNTLPKGGFGSMTDLIGKLLTQGVAYEAGGDVYFAVRKFPGYGRFSNRALDDLQAGSRVEPGKHKQDPLDFALWKAAKPGEPSWKSPWGEGRPGWHIECSAMSTYYLGDAFDIHGGGVDLVFPHHENEVAQAQAAGKPFAKYWVHNGLLTVNGEKMSKSLKNYTTVDDALKACGGEPDALKTFFLGTHYRSPADYTTKNLKAAQTRWQRLHHFLHFAGNRAAAGGTAPAEAVTRLAQEFERAMDEDLNTPKALAALDQLATLGYQHEDARASAADALLRLARALGLFDRLQPVRLTPAVQERLAAREAARKSKDFKTSDRIRQELAGQGLAVEDTPDGPVVIPAP